MSIEKLGLKWMEVDLAAFIHNIELLEQRAGSAKLIAVLKADAYGHGAAPLARLLEKRPALQAIAVATLSEAISLRLGHIKCPILLLGAVPLTEIEDILIYDITPTLCEVHFAQELSRKAALFGKKVQAHLYVDTGMGRMGLRPESLEGYMELLLGLSHVSITHLYTHFSVADEKSEDAKNFTQNQWQQLETWAKKHAPHLKIHAANSAGLLAHPYTFAHAVRPGLALYGQNPLEDSADSFDADEQKNTQANSERLDEAHEKLSSRATYTQALAKQLCPIMSLHLKPLFVKRLKKGQHVGYGRGFTLEEDSNILTLPAGYADGIARALGPHLFVRYEKRTYPVVGRVCMDMLMVNLGQDSLKEDAVLTLLDGKEGDLALWSKISGLLPYELMTGLGRRWSRYYKGHGLPWAIKAGE